MPGAGGSVARRASLGLRAALRTLIALLVACHAGQVAAGRRAEVASVRQLRAALADDSISEVAVLPGGSWNFSREEWGAGAVRIHRAVLLEGVPSPDGRPPYVDANQLAELVVVGANGSLHQRGLFVDDCMLPAMPLLCFAVGADDGSLVMDQLVLGDASCTNIGRSVATDWLLKTAYWATWHTSWTQADDRTILVNDTGEIRGMPPGVTWRIHNSTFRCTGNDTHPLPSGGAAAAAGGAPSQAQVAVASLATLASLLAGAYWLLNRNVVTVHRNESPEAAVARAKGIVLLGVIGKGTFGRVYRARYKGQTVAIKVIDFSDGDKRAAAAVTKECQHVMACHHPCVAACLTYFTVTVRSHISRRDRLRSSMYVLEQDMVSARQQQQGGGHSQPTMAHAGTPAARQPDDQPSTSAAARGAAPPDGAAGGSAPAPSPAASSSSNEGASTDCSSDVSSDGGTADGSMTLLVMEYCALGNLHRAITAAHFRDRHTGQPKLDWVCRTALDVALGLQHLHDKRNIVHRDVSTNNILLMPHPADPRGFTAKLSDFGLSTVLANRRTHKTSQLKGTVDFMPPEIFTSGEVRFAVDTYGLGIVLFYMVQGHGPFTGLAPFQVVGKKLEEAHRKQHLVLPPAMPPELQRLVWDCTHWDPRQRPTAAEVARRLEEIISKLGQSGEPCAAGNDG